MTADSAFAVAAGDSAAAARPAPMNTEPMIFFMGKPLFGRADSLLLGDSMLSRRGRSTLGGLVEIAWRFQVDVSATCDRAIQHLPGAEYLSWGSTCLKSATCWYCPGGRFAATDRRGVGSWPTCGWRCSPLCFAADSARTSRYGGCDISFAVGTVRGWTHSATPRRFSI